MGEAEWVGGKNIKRGVSEWWRRKEYRNSQREPLTYIQFC